MYSHTIGKHIFHIEMWFRLVTVSAQKYQPFWVFGPKQKKWFLSYTTWYHSANSSSKTEVILNTVCNMYSHKMSGSRDPATFLNLKLAVVGSHNYLLKNAILISKCFEAPMYFSTLFGIFWLLNKNTTYFAKKK